jgi:hypothetical protein
MPQDNGISMDFFWTRLQKHEKQKHKETNGITSKLFCTAKKQSTKKKDNLQDIFVNICKLHLTKG